MKDVFIHFDPYQPNSGITINSRPVSRYSELNDVINLPIYEWAERFTALLRTEVNDEYRLKVEGEELEQRLLGDICAAEPRCKSYTTADFEPAYPLDRRVDEAKRSIADARTFLAPGSFRVKCFADAGSVTFPSDWAMPTDADSAQVIASNRPDMPDRVRRMSGSKILLISSPSPSVEFLGPGKLVWRVQPADMSRVINCIFSRIGKVAYVCKAAEKLASRRPTSTAPAAAHVASAAATVTPTASAEATATATAAPSSGARVYRPTPSVSVDDIPTLEVGQSHTLSYSMTPAGSPLPSIRVVSSNPSVLRVEGSSVRALYAGNSTLKFYLGVSVEPFAEKRVHVITVVHATAISLATDIEVVRIGQSFRVIPTVTPSTAEDVGDIVWSFEPSHLLERTGDGCFIARGEGTVRVRAATSHVRQELSVRIFPALTEVDVNVDLKYFYVAQSREIEVIFRPEDAPGRDSYYWMTDNELIAKVEKDELNRYILRAVGVGTCRVTLMSPSREIVKDLVVTVKSALTESNSGILHSLTWFGIYATILDLIPWRAFLPVVSLILMAAHVVFTVLGVILKFKSDDETRYKVYNVVIGAISLIVHFFLL